ncbi:hypothetical protein C8Q74DRAFT_1288211 [Fomes fomentarius]|nr:hypothetical protein C8Q74DRAFT_1288211 [Fomes fomentarius]
MASLEGNSSPTAWVSDGTHRILLWYCHNMTVAHFPHSAVPQPQPRNHATSLRERWYQILAVNCCANLLSFVNRSPLPYGCFYKSAVGLAQPPSSYGCPWSTSASSVRQCPLVVRCSTNLSAIWAQQPL